MCSPVAKAFEIICQIYNEELKKEVSLANRTTGHLMLVGMGNLHKNQPSI